ncbi:EAL domain-containing protein [Bacillus sp. RO1]|uniref:EAL domain-containing protein n=1 Tax=Bacillus sp. RO1 TaxID=2722703 RepID=UPI0014567328|nr:EAL domain-containing protein [Bacillus sp. RO1]NLP51889.1 EAL domain-containing protein [Bacillus sp. RO1]
MKTFNIRGRKTESTVQERLQYQELFTAIFDNHPHTVLLLNAAGEIEMRNKQSTKQFGYKPKEIAGDFSKFIPIDYQNDVRAKFAEALQGLPLHYDTKVIHKNKSIVDVSITSVPVFEVEKVVGIYVVVKNIEKEKRAESELKNMKTSMKLVQDSAKIGSWQYELATGEISWSKQALAIYGVLETHQCCFTLESLLNMIHPEDIEKFKKVFDKALETLSSTAVEYRVVKHDESIIYVHVHSDIVVNEKGVPTRFIGTVMDVTETRELQRQLETKEQESKAIYDSLELGIWSYSFEEEAYIYFSKGVEKITGYTLDELYSEDFVLTDLILEDDLDWFHHNHILIKKGQEVEQEYRIVLPSGKYRWIRDHVIPVKNDNGEVTKIHGIISDVTEHKLLLDKVNHLANHDYLTELPNRRKLKETMQELVENYEETRREFAVFYIDLDRFKYINDTLGHPIGDELLRAVAERLLRYKSQGHFVSRVGGDEFILLYHEENLLAKLKDIASGLMRNIKAPYNIGEYELYLTACVGVSVFPIDGKTEEVLLKNADIALYRAKELGKNYFEIYTPSISVKTYQQFTLERDMHKAIKEEQFEIYFQPKVNATSYEIVGAEALIRWDHPIWGMLSPGEFIPLAEESGIINEIGDYVMHKVLKQISCWKRERVPVVPISINVAPQRFLRKNYYNMVKQAIETYQVSPSYLELEITETSFLHNTEVVLKMVQELRKLGVKVALDDFGTGYSSMTRLTELDIDVLKVDRSFVKDVETNRKNAVILESLIIIAKELNMEVVVEGVETEGQLKFMQEKNCDIIQGYIFSKPVPASMFTDMLEVGTLKPLRIEGRKPFVDRRNYFRIELPKPIKGELTVKQIQGKDVQLGQTAVVIGNIGPGGLRLLSHMQFPVRDDLILAIEFMLLGEVKNVSGKIVWKEESKCNYQYGLSFLLNDEERMDITKLLNHTAIQLRSSNLLEKSNVIQTTPEKFLEEIR